MALTRDLIRFRPSIRRATPTAPAATIVGRRLADAGSRFPICGPRAPWRQRRLSPHQHRGALRDRPARALRAFQQPYRRGRAGRGLDPRSVRGGDGRRQDLRARRLRHEGRARRQHRGRGADRTVPDLPGTIEISGTVDEESGGYAGVAWLAERGYFSPPRVDHVIIPEPLTRTASAWAIAASGGARSKCAAGSPHGSMPFLGQSAIRGMAAISGAGRKRALSGAQPAPHPNAGDPRRRPASRPSTSTRCTAASPRSRPDRTACRPPWLPIPPGGPGPSLSDGDPRRGGGRDRGAAGEDRGGLPPVALRDPRNVVGGPHHDRRATRRWSPPSPRRSSACWANRPATSPRRGPTTKHIARLGKLEDCIAYGPGILELAHQPDEYIVIEDMVQSARVMAAATWRLLNGDAPRHCRRPGF